MQITKRSGFTGITHTREINVTEQQLKAWQDGMLIQSAMPNLSASDREYLMTGATPEEWKATFGGDDEEEEQQQEPSPT